TPWQLFWSELLKGRSQIGIVLDARKGLNGALDPSQVQASLPLVSLANAYRVEPLIRGSDKPDYDTQSTLLIHLSNRLPPNVDDDPRVRFVIRESGDESRIEDRQVPGRAWSHAALITVVRDANPTVVISGTDVDAIREGVRTLS